MAAQLRLPNMVQGSARHPNARHSCQRAGRRGICSVTQPLRLPDGGLIDRTQPLAFEYDGVRYQGYAGDTLASALLANGVHLVARSFKYHRPRGIVSAGPEEPCALVRIGEGARVRPAVPATMVELYDGLLAASVNCWPSVDFDLGAVNN